MIIPHKGDTLFSELAVREDEITLMVQKTFENLTSLKRVDLTH